ncbi:hypothetical protein BGW80DRAFT_1445412 [Lactifluus volemus]|nr:hypothetical protein BGW80DRAFT_1445412 [Lactifluus volemus]
MGNARHTSTKREQRCTRQAKIMKETKRKRRATRGRRGQVYGRGVVASWPRAIVAQFEIETARERNPSSPENSADSSTGRDEEEAELVWAGTHAHARYYVVLTLTFMLGSFFLLEGPSERRYKTT